MNTFSLKVIASDKVFFDGKCGIIIVPALDGEQAIMSHHEDMVIATREGEVRFKEKEEDDWTKAVVGVGCVYISHNRVIMLVDTAERPEDIDRVRAEAALERAQEQLRILKRFYRNDRKITISELHTFANITGLILLLFTYILRITT